jgi:hypothetical protein
MWYRLEFILSTTIITMCHCRRFQTGYRATDAQWLTDGHQYFYKRYAKLTCLEFTLLGHKHVAGHPFRQIAKLMSWKIMHRLFLSLEIHASCWKQSIRSLLPIEVQSVVAAKFWFLKIQTNGPVCIVGTNRLPTDELQRSNKNKHSLLPRVQVGDLSSSRLEIWPGTHMWSPTMHHKHCHAKTIFLFANKTIVSLQL